MTSEDAGLDRIRSKADLIEFYASPARRAAAVAALGRSPGAVEAHLVSIGQIQGMTTDANRLRSTLQSELRRQQSTLRVMEPGQRDRVHVCDAIARDDYPEGVEVPAGWLVRDRSLYRITADGEVIVGAVVVVTRRLVDCDTRDWMVELSWWDQRWRHEVVPREVAMSAHVFVGLASRGVPVSSASARYIVAWLAALDQQEMMPTDWCSARMGWVGRDDGYFLLGQRVLSRDGSDHRVDLTAQGGGQQLAEAMTSHGTWEGWLDTIALAGRYPSAYVAVYAAATAPLLKWLGAPNFGIDWVGQQGTGKTTSLRLGTSVGAKPVLGEGMRSWSASLPGLEASAAISCDLPLCIDEGQLVPPQRYAEAGTWLYGLINGAGKTKGALGRMGQARVEHWRIALLSTSEVGITRWSPFDGARARIIELRGYPLGADNAALAEEIERRLLLHHGHLMPRLVEHLLGLDAAGRSLLVQAYHTIIAELGATATSPLARRAARVVAAIGVTSTILHDRLGVPRPEVDVGAWLWDQVQRVCSDGDRPRAAMEAVLDWAWSLRANFQMTPKDPQPSQGWLGLWLDEGERIAVVPDTLDKFLAKAGFPEPRAIYAEWKRRGWIDCETGKFTRKCRTPGEGRLVTPARYVVVKANALDDVDE